MLKTRPGAAIAAMLVAAGMLPLSAKADTTFTEGVKHRIYTLHTHLASLPLDLPPRISSKNKEYKTAAVCFISDTAACSDEMFGGKGNGNGNGNGWGVPDYGLSNKERCAKEGYTINDCPDGMKPGGKRCMYGNYYSECVTACPSDYVSCEEPFYGVGEACDGKYASCDCKPCGTGFDYTEIPDGYEQVGEGCLDCDGQTKYKVVAASCDGFQQCGDLGPVFGSESCLSGTTTLYKECNTCPNIGKYASSAPECSAPFKCTLEDCSGKFYQSGCIEGYVWDETAKTCTCEGVDWCAITPSCTDLGYKQQTCNGTSIKCPFDVDYSFCTGECGPVFKYICTSANEIGGVGSACGGKYASCECAEGYVWKDGACQLSWGQCSGYAAQCSLGDILFSDGTCSANTVSGKTPIAVVVYISSEGCGQAMALESIGSYTWGGYGTDIPTLPNYETDEAASKDYDSCGNTAKIIATGNNGAYPAAWAVHQYSTEGTRAGDWCLPAPRIFISYYNNQDAINKGFKRANGTQFTSSTLAWSSSEYSDGQVWISAFFTETGLYLRLKNYDIRYNTNLRPVIEF